MFSLKNYFTEKLLILYLSFIYRYRFPYWIAKGIEPSRLEILYRSEASKEFLAELKMSIQSRALLGVVGDR